MKIKFLLKNSIKIINTLVVVSLKCDFVSSMNIYTRSLFNCNHVRLFSVFNKDNWKYFV